MTSANVITLGFNTVSTRTGKPMGRLGFLSSLVATTKSKVNGIGQTVRQTFSLEDQNEDGSPTATATGTIPSAGVTYTTAMGTVGLRSAARNYGAGTFYYSWTLGKGRTNTFAPDTPAAKEHHKHLVIRQVSGPDVADWLANIEQYAGKPGPVVEVIPQR